MHGSLHFGNEIGQNRLIQLAEHQPFGAAGRASDRADRGWVKSVSFNGFEGTGAGS